MLAEGAEAIVQRLCKLDSPTANKLALLLREIASLCFTDKKGLSDLPGGPFFVGRAA